MYHSNLLPATEGEEKGVFLTLCPSQLVERSWWVCEGGGREEREIGRRGKEGGRYGRKGGRVRGVEIREGREKGREEGEGGKEEKGEKSVFVHAHMYKP